MKQYIYIFTRQDISIEQQAVQSAHVTLKLGYYIGSSCNIPGFDPNKTYFTLVGVRNLEALEAVISILDAFGFLYESFYEPDMGDEMTSIATFPIDEDKRDALLAFNLLKMS